MPGPENAVEALGFEALVNGIVLGSDIVVGLEEERSVGERVNAPPAIASGARRVR